MLSPKKKSPKKRKPKVIKFVSQQAKADTLLTTSAKKLKKSKFSKRDITYTYAIFPTKKGKGYGCFAVRPEKDGFFTVAASFCAPSDRARFSKVRARNVACKRLQAQTAKVIEGDPKEERNRTALCAGGAWRADDGDAGASDGRRPDPARAPGGQGSARRA